jgi:hypothetical protein
MSDYHSSTLHTADVQSWVFNVSKLDGFELSATHEAKSAVAEVEDIEYRRLRARLVAPLYKDAYVVVIEV